MIRGVLGGSFDPVHSGHLAMARFVLDQGLADVLHVIPARVSPHKEHPGAPPEQRLAMVGLAFLDLPGVIIDDRELRRPGPSYTVDTLAELAAEFPGDRLLLVIGQDNVAGLDTWRDLERIGRLAEVAVLARPDLGLAEGHPAPNLPDSLTIRFHPDFRQPVSSSRIRAILADSGFEQRDLTGLLPQAVADFIARNQLYR